MTNAETHRLAVGRDVDGSIAGGAPSLEKTPDGKYKVTLNVQARKVQADGNGVESRMPLADYIEIGVFSGKKDSEKPLYTKKEKLTQERSAFTGTAITEWSAAI